MCTITLRCSSRKISNEYMVLASLLLILIHTYSVMFLVLAKISLFTMLCTKVVI